MKEEDKDLLLKDLCGRLPYGVKCKDDYAQIEGKLCQIGTNYDMCLLSDENGESKWALVSNCKPCLFPISSMTEEQKNVYHSFYADILRCLITPANSVKLVDWLNKNHFDFRNLIGLNLAIDCTNLNIY